MASGRAVDDSSPRSTATLALFLGLLALGNALVLFFVYRSHMQIQFRYFPYWRDDVALYGALALMASMVLAPVAPVALLLAGQGRLRTSWFLAGAWSFFCSLFLLTDAAALSISGSHLVHYLAYAKDILAHPELQGLEMIGGAWGVARQALLVVVEIAILMLGSYLGAVKATSNGRLVKFTRIGWLVVLLSLPLSQGLWSDFVVSSMAYQRLAVPLPLFPKLDIARNARGVKMVEAIRSSLKEDKMVLRNFSAAQDLTGWRLVTRRASVPLSGTLDSNAEMEVPIDLEAKTGWVSLVNQSGASKDVLQFTPASSNWVASLPYPRGRISQFDPAVKALETHLRQAILRPVPPDPKPRVEKKKHVVILIFESLRRDALTPQSAPNITAWGARGLRLEQHMSGANGTHLGLYSLFYSRAAIFYRRDLDAGLPPQMTETMRASGYRTSYLASATSMGWMWMERMLGPQAFHEIKFGDERRSVSGWNAWPSKDEAMFKEVPDRLRQAEQPQLLVLHAMSTHYPYAFPTDFDRRRPSQGETQDSRALSGASQEILKNRYLNSVEYLDHLFGQMMKEIDHENTVVIVTGDHGEGLWDDGDLSHGTRPSEVQLAVPCVVVGAGVPTRVLTTPSYHADLLPTLLHLLNGKSGSIAGSHGIDLLEPTERDSIPIVPIVPWPPYSLLFAGPDARLKFNIDTDEWFSGRRDLGVLDPKLRVSFAGDVRADGSLSGNLPKDFDFAAWNRRLEYWTELLSQ